MGDLKIKNASCDFSALFQATPDLYLVLSPDLDIVEVNEAYLKATMVKREDILGRNVFEVFPDNPQDPEATGTKNLRASLLRVLEHKKPDTMAVQKYDIRRPLSEGGAYEERYWSPVNTPVVGEDGKIKYIIHRVEDATAFIKLKQSASEQLKITEELRQRTGKMEIEIYQRAQEIQEVNKQLRIRNAELAKKKKEQEELYEKLEKLSQLKTQFFANVSHELRTPLTLILGPIEKLLSNKSLLAQHTDFIMIERNARMLLRLIDDLLDIAKLESGKTGLTYVRLDLAKHLRQVTALFESNATVRQIDFSEQFPQTLIAEVDPEKIQRVVMNLLSNAFKYTPPHGKVSCQLSSKNDHALLIISDTGPGIPPELHQLIFERFFRGAMPLAAPLGGFGLGLAIVKDFIELHGGTIRVGTAAGGGAAFIIELPLKAPSSCTVQAEWVDSGVISEARDPLFVDEKQLQVLKMEPPALREDAAPKHAKKNAPLVLVVEDNTDLNQYICEILSSHYRTISAFDGHEGLIQTLERRPDIILSDIMMPKMNGIELLQKLRARKDLDEIPVIVLTAKADEALSVKLLSAGAQDYLAKPFSQAELKIRVTNLINLKKATEALEQRNEDLSSANQALEAFSYTVSHDLRNPLQAISGFGSLMRDSAQMGEEEKDYLNEILNAAKNMENLIEDLLNFSHSTRQVLETKKVDLSALVKAILEDLKKQDPTRQITYKIQEKVTAQCDPNLIKIVFQNLLHNAWKFTAKNDRPIIEFGVIGKETPIYFIRDNGAGFPVEKKDKLFQPFSRLHAAKDFMGTGIGLSTVKRIIERHEGHVWADSEFGKGATFYLQF